MKLEYRETRFPCELATLFMLTSGCTWTQLPLLMAVSIQLFEVVNIDSAVKAIPCFVVCRTSFTEIHVSENDSSVALTEGETVACLRRLLKSQTQNIHICMFLAFFPKINLLVTTKLVLACFERVMWSSRVHGNTKEL